MAADEGAGGTDHRAIAQGAHGPNLVEGRSLGRRRRVEVLVGEPDLGPKRPEKKSEQGRAVIGICEVTFLDGPTSPQLYVYGKDQFYGVTALESGGVRIMVRTAERELSLFVSAVPQEGDSLVRVGISFSTQINYDASEVQIESIDVFAWDARGRPQSIDFNLMAISVERASLLGKRQDY